METNFDELPSEVTYKQMYMVDDDHGTPYNNGGNGNGNSYGVDGNQGNGKGNLNPNHVPLSDGMFVYLFLITIYIIIKHKIFKRSDHSKGTVNVF